MVLMCWYKKKKKSEKKIILMHFQAKNTFEKHFAPQYQKPMQEGVNYLSCNSGYHIDFHIHLLHDWAVVVN